MLLMLYMKMEVLTKDVYKYTNKYKMKSLYITICIILGIALLPISGGFYILVRIIVTIGAIAATIQNSSNGINIWSIIFGIIVILFNPLVPVYLHDKGAWGMIDIIAIILFIIQIVRNK